MDIKETMEEYGKAFNEPAPMPMNLGNAYLDEYEDFLKKAIKRGKPIAEEELDEFLSDKEYDLAEEGEALDKGIRKGLKQ